MRVTRKRVLRAIKAAGRKIASIDVEDGRVRIRLVETDSDDNTNPWDEVDPK